MLAVSLRRPARVPYAEVVLGLHHRGSSLSVLVGVSKACDPPHGPDHIFPKRRRAATRSARAGRWRRCGFVTSVRVRSELGERPIEVRLRVETPYDLAIPSDSTAQLSTAGVLGPTLVDINTRHAQGTRIGNNGVLGTSEMTDAQASQAMKHLVETITKTPVAAKKPSSSTK